MSQTKKRPYKKIALALSLCTLILWGVLGTGTSLAWFTDTSNEVNNIFHFADFELEVSRRTENGNWESIDGKSELFDDKALYEPGYVQVVYLRVENTGDVPFDFYTAVSVKEPAAAINRFGQEFWLHEHLKFGVAVANSESEMNEKVSTRDKAEAIATKNLQNYDNLGIAPLNAGESAYLALVVRMPETIGDEANYRGNKIPEVELGLIVKAEQKKN